MPFPKPAITDLTAQIPSTSYRVGRYGTPISQISEHHVVGDARHAISKANGGSFSCTFTIGMDGTIYQLVQIPNTPSTDNSWESNKRSITIEHAGGLLPDYPYTDAMYEASAKLHAWLFSTYGALKPVRHRDIPEVKADPKKATSCPGQLDVERILNTAGTLLGGKGAIIDSNMLIGSGDNWRFRFNRLHRQLVRNGDMSDPVFQAIVGQDAWKVVEAWSDHQEANQLLRDQELGERARKEDWQGALTVTKSQLADLTDKLRAAVKAPNTTNVDEALQMAVTCQTQLADATTQAKTDQDTGNALLRFLGRLFRLG